MRRWLLLALTHGVALALGFASGVYLLPILVAPPAPPQAQLHEHAASALYRAEFRRDLEGSDLLHWGEGTVSVGRDAISLAGRLAPGPDYKLYLVSGFVATKDAFLRVKPQAVRVGDVRTFQNFIVPVPAAIDVARYDTVVVWCETFSMFISAAKYR